MSQIILPNQSEQLSVHPKPPQIVYGKDDPMFRGSWSPHSVGDRGSRDSENYIPGLCQCCGNKGLRYVHTLKSPYFPDRIEVGRECAAKLCPQYNALRAERKLRTRNKRFGHWITKPWLNSTVGNQYLNGQHYETAVVSVRPGYRWWIHGTVNIWSQTTYSTSYLAFRGLFDYLDDKDMLGIRIGEKPNFSLIAALQEIERLSNQWAEPFSHVSDSYYMAGFSTLLGRVACTIYDDGPFWNFHLLLPDLKTGSKKYLGPKRKCQTPIEAKIDALELFRKEMTRLAYEMAGLAPEDIPPPSTESERKAVADFHNRMEVRRKAEIEAGERALAEKQRQDEEKAKWDKKVAAELIRGFGERIQGYEPQKSGIRQNNAIGQKPSPVAFDPLQLRVDIEETLDDWKADWQKGWSPTHNNPRHFVKDVSCRFFSANCVLFLKGGRYKFVLHMPRNETFSERSYQTASDAAEGAYNNLRVYIMSMLKNTPEYFVEYEKRPVRV